MARIPDGELERLKNEMNHGMTLPCGVARRRKNMLPPFQWLKTRRCYSFLCRYLSD